MRDNSPSFFAVYSGVGRRVAPVDEELLHATVAKKRRVDKEKRLC
ncbi:MAG: hypothetical protein ABJA18_02595 [bacterium]